MIDGVVDVAGIKVALRCSAADAGDFLATPDHADVHLVQRPAHSLTVDWDQCELVYESLPLWRLYKTPSQWMVVAGVESPYQISMFSEDFRFGVVYDDTPDLNLMDPTFFRWLMTHLLPGYGGLFLHAAGIAIDGAGYVFAGQSGSGKTTMAHLWAADAKVLSDEGVIIRHQEGQWWLYGTPLQSEGGTSAQGRVPLKAICFIRHGVENQATALATVPATTTLIASAYMPLWDEAGVTRSVQLAADIVESIPCFDLGFVPDQHILEFIRCAM